MQLILGILSQTPSFIILKANSAGHIFLTCTKNFFLRTMSLSKNPCVKTRENGANKFYILSIKTRSKPTTPWSKESITVNSSKEYENTYGSRETAEADLKRFQVWAEKGKRFRDQFPFVREQKRTPVCLALQ